MEYLKRNEVAIGDVRELAARLEPQSIQCLITSPPYFGLRSYLDNGHADKGKELGSEATPAEFVANLVAVFAALRDCLKDDGTLWLNLGDSYAVNGGGRSYGTTDGAVGRADAPGGQRKAPAGYPPKCLMGMPWRCAFALIDDGWILRSDIIWAKPAPMPESVTDRPTRSHEYLFLLTKQNRYFYDAEAIREPHLEASIQRVKTGLNTDRQRGYPGAAQTLRMGEDQQMLHPNGRNKRSVWTITSAQFPDAHYATFPPDLVRPCVLAGTSAAGECSACGKAWARCVEREKVPDSLRNRGSGSKMDFHTWQVGGGQKIQDWYDAHPAQTTGWAPQCQCPPGTPTRPQLVLDPFLGSGTTAAVAFALGRDWIGLDLDERALKWTADRLAGMPVGVLPGMAG